MLEIYSEQVRDLLSAKNPKGIQFYIHCIHIDVLIKRERRWPCGSSKSEIGTFLRWRFEKSGGWIVRRN